MNVGLRGVSASFGVPGARVTVGRRGVHGTVGIPGTGLSFSQRLDAPRRGRGQRAIEPSTSEWPDQESPAFLPPAIPSIPAVPAPGARGPRTDMREIASAGAYRLTSQSLQQLRDTLLAAGEQMDAVETEIGLARAQLDRFSGELSRKRRSFFRAFRKKRIRRLESYLVPAAQEELDRLTQWQTASRVPLEVTSESAEQAAWDALTFSFDQLRQCAIIWDVMRDATVDRGRERSSATRSLERQAVEFAFGTHRLIGYDDPALNLGNANGEAIILYPGFAIVEGGGAVALIDQHELQVGFELVRFIEQETPPGDGRLVDHTWLKANKDGSPDRRFAGNRQIPIYLYGKMTLRTPTGLNEEYQFSDPARLEAFAGAMQAYRKAIGAPL